ncbi:hypothetical protein pipiens_010700, partial [Culex pipiens pipiens]
GSLTKAFRISSGYKPRAGGSGTSNGGGGSDKNSVYSSTSPTPSYSSSEGGIYAAVGFHQLHGHLPHHHLPPPTTAPPPVPSSGGGVPSPLATADQRANYRVSAPPMDGSSSSSSMATLPKYGSQHRRVKSISDIEVAAAVGSG